MNKGSDVPMYVFTVRWTGLDGQPHEAKVQAAYFQESAVYTIFKDGEHAVVDVFRTAGVERIKRVEKLLGPRS